MSVLASEIAAPVAIGLLTAAVLAVALSAHGQQIFFYDGDSLVLPLFRQSIAAGQPMEWVMSSQLFLLPELPLYLLCSAIVGGSVKAALALNAILNSVLLYALFRACAAHIGWPRRWHRIAAPMLASLVFLVFVALEIRGTQTNGSVATFTLLTTYYYGATMTALALLALALWLTRAFQRTTPVRSPRYGVFAAASALLLGVQTVSNPLVLLQFAVPFLGALAFASLLHVLPWRMTVLLAAPLLAGGAAGYLARFALSRYLLPNAGSYVHFSQIPESLSFFAGVLRTFVSTPLGITEAVLLLLLLGAAVATGIRSLREPHRSPSGVVIPVFVIGSVLVTVVGSVLVGSTATRYLGPVFVFPLLVLLAPALWRRSAKRAHRVMRITATVAGAAVLLASAMVATPAIATLTTITAQSASPGLSCLQRWIGDRNIVGEGSYWASRALDVYGTGRVDVLQVDSTLGARAWMTNLASFRDRAPSYFIVDAPSRRALAIRLLGTPSAVIDCGPFQVYDYAGTAGQNRMTVKIASSARYQLTRRGYADPVESAER